MNPGVLLVLLCKNKQVLGSQIYRNAKGSCAKVYYLKMVAEAGIPVMIVAEFGTTGTLGIIYAFTSLRLYTNISFL